MPKNPAVAIARPNASQPAAEITPPLLPRGKKPLKVLLLDGYSTRTLACVRSWGEKGLAFAVGGETRWDMSLFSRYTREKFVYTSPKRDICKFIQDVNRYCQEFAADCVLPTSEAAILACDKHRNELSCVPIIPEKRDIQITLSKRPSRFATGIHRWIWCWHLRIVRPRPANRAFWASQNPGEQSIGWTKRSRRNH